MEKIKPVVFFRKFGFQVLLFNAVLLVAIIVPSLLLRKQDYKILMDNLVIHENLFWHCYDKLSAAPSSEWPELIETLPRILNQQRICIFSPEIKLVHDSGIMKKYNQFERFSLLFPSPYIDWKNCTYTPDVHVLTDYLQPIKNNFLDPYHKYVEMVNIQYPEGLDRIIISGVVINTKDKRKLVFVLTTSVVDLLINARALKERFLLVYGTVVFLALLLTVLLSWSVTSPLKKLYKFSQGIPVSRWNEENIRKLPIRGEVGEICLSLKKLIKEQKTRADNFRQFSSDIVHELKTPLSAIRSGLELYSESGDTKEKEEIYTRINRRIQQMEKLMDEIRFIGDIESGSREEKCGAVFTAIREALPEFAKFGIRTYIPEEDSGYCIYASAEKLFQVVQNLVKNAVSFSPEQGSVSVSAFVKNGNLIIAVQDRGPGIRKEAFDAIKTRFFSFRPDSAEKHSGLGLSIIDAIARSAGGTLQYRNRQKGGAEFNFTIPVYTGRAEE